MKKLFLVITAVLLASTAHAGGHHHITINNTNNTYVEDINNSYGVGIDAPNLIRFSNNWTAGVEANKNLNQTDMGEGYQVLGKITYTGSIFSLKK